MEHTQTLVVCFSPPPATYRLTAGQVRSRILGRLERSIQLILTVETNFQESGVMKKDNRREATYQSRPLSDPLLACVPLFEKIVDMRSKTNSSCCCVEVPFWLLGVFKLPSVHAPLVWCSPGLHIPVIPPSFGQRVTS